MSCTVRVRLRARALRITAVCVPALIACAGSPRQPPPDLLAFPHDSALFAVLAGEPGPAQLDALERYEAAAGQLVTDTLAVIADDTTLHPLLRANALLLLGRREPGRHLLTVGMALEEPDERMQLAAVGVLREVIDVQPAVAMRLLAVALRSPSAAVQARVLETIAARDAELLREYIGRAPPPALLRIAGDLLAVAEERGAPLPPADSTGRLERTGPAGHSLRYEPRKRWPGGVSVGALTLLPQRAAPVALGDVEVAGSVVPAFFSADGTFLVWETDRTIRVRDVAGGTVRDAGPGIAPRAMPFTPDFLFLREIAGARTVLRAGTRIQYEVLRAPFALPPGDTTPLAIFTGLAANAGMTLNGGASPVRWMRVVELADGAFALVGEGMDTTRLPDPFALGGSGR